MPAQFNSIMAQLPVCFLPSLLATLPLPNQCRYYPPSFFPCLSSLLQFLALLIIPVPHLFHIPHPHLLPLSSHPKTSTATRRRPLRLRRPPIWRRLQPRACRASRPGPEPPCKPAKPEASRLAQEHGIEVGQCRCLRRGRDIGWRCRKLDIPLDLNLKGGM